MKYEVIDNFLPQDEFDKLSDLLHQQIPFYFQKEINAGHVNDKQFYMTHMLFNIEQEPMYSTFYWDFKTILNKLNVKALMRMKINLYPKTSELETHKPHWDYNYEHKGCILSFNTCDGATILKDGTKIIKK